MKKSNKIKALVIAICMLAAGICYSGTRPGTWTALSEGRTADTDTVFKNQEETDIQGEAATAGEAGGSSEETGDLKTESDQSSQIAAEEKKHTLFVYICGEIVNPGVYQMEEGSRVYQAIERAGGFAEGAAAEYLNMADTLQDGMKLVVPSSDELQADQKYGGSALSDPGGKSEQNTTKPVKVNLNTAGREELMTLKGIGEAKAEDIICYRKEQGPFQKIEDIMKISGIKDAAFQKIKNDITV